MKGGMISVTRSKNTRSKKRGAALALAVLAMIGVAVAAIVANRADRSSPVSGALEPPAALRSMTWHEAPLPVVAVAFQDQDGKALTLDDFAGRYRLINLWATWCGPCLQELPALDHLQRQAGGDGFVVLVVSQDRIDDDRVARFWADAGLPHLTLYLDPKLGAGRALAARGLPTTVLVDPAGLELARLEGPLAWDDPAIVEFFAKLGQAG
jgi:thiol-disulfide isomerase/thioredoxin